MGGGETSAYPENFDLALIGISEPSQPKAHALHSQDQGLFGYGPGQLGMGSVHRMNG